MKFLFRKNILLAIFLDVSSFLSLSLMFSSAQSLNYNPQTHIIINNSIYNFAIDLFLLFISQITLIQVINIRLLKDRKDIKIVHLVFLGLVLVSLLVSTISPLIQGAQCEKIIRFPVYKYIDEGDHCATFMENVGKGLFVQYFLGIPAIFLFTFISRSLNMFIMKFEAFKDNRNFKLVRVISILLILAYPLYVLLRIPYFLNNT